MLHLPLAFFEKGIHDDVELIAMKTIPPIEQDVDQRAASCHQQ
jgi:hypothetical protein